MKYEPLPPVGSKGAVVDFSHAEWTLLRDVFRDSLEFDHEDMAHVRLLAKLDWHCSDTFDIPDDDRPKPAENE